MESVPVREQFILFAFFRHEPQNIGNFLARFASGKLISLGDLFGDPQEDIRQSEQLGNVEFG
jgi:hypothetical protein